MEPILYLETGSQDPAYNLAFEETVLCRRTGGDILILWQNADTVVVGRNQNTEAEIDRAFVEAHHIRVVRRNTGGGAVYHDLGNLNYSFMTNAGSSAQDSIACFTALVAGALRGLGLRAECSGRNDILVDGRKVSGTAQYQLEGRLLHHGTLLFDADLDMVAGALRADPEKFRSKSSGSVRSRVGNIRPALPVDMELSAFWFYLKSALTAGGLAPARLTREELAAVRRLKEEKYDTWAWNFGRSPDYGVVKKRRWPGGSLEVRANVESGIVTAIAFFGDFMALGPTEDIAARLTGLPFDRAAFSSALTEEQLRSCFGSLGRDELLDTIFY